MKRLVFLLMVLLFTVAVKPQQVVNDQNGQYTVLFTLPSQTASGDSTDALTQTFTLPNDYAYADMTIHPCIFALKTVGTYGAPKCLIVIRGYYNGMADSVNFDTLRISATNQSQTDTSGVIQFTNYSKNKRAEKYAIAVTNTGKAIASGFVELVFEKQQYLPNYNYSH